MPVELVLRDRKYVVAAGQTVRKALENLDIVPETVLPVRQGKLVPEDEVLKEGESIRLVAVISGGSGDPRR